MPEIPAAPQVARRLADALEFAGIPYAIGGAIAYGLYGPPRATNDVDLNVFTALEGIDSVFDALETVASVDRASARASARDRGDFIVRVEGMRVDVFLPSIAIVEAAASRVRTATLLGRPIRVLSVEDLVLFKMLFFRSKDRTDVERLVHFLGREIDRGYVRRCLVETVGEDDERVATWDGLIRGPGA